MSRIVTYARVSTLRQESEGESLANQRRAFERYQERTAAHVIAAYEEAASAKSIAGRAEFSRMIAELPHTRPDFIVIDTLDRFTRNLREGLNTLEQLRGHHIGLLPLDWQRKEPIDLDDDGDWSQVVEEFKAAERERRRISARMKRSWQGRRERGAAMTNRPAFGLRKVGDRLEPDPQTLWIVTEAEERALRGEHFLDIVRWVQSVYDGRWGHISTFQDIFANTSYVTAGARSIERQQALNDLLALRASRFGQRRKHENEFTGIFLCGHCYEEGLEVLMTGSIRRDGRDKNYRYPFVVCSADQDQRLSNKRHNFSVQQSRFENQWWMYIERFIQPAGEELLRRWASEQTGDVAERQRTLTQRLARIDQQSAALKTRRDRALDILGDKSAAVKRQARKALEDVERDEMALNVTRQTIVAELAAAPQAKRDPRALSQALLRYREVYENAPVRTRNQLNRELCAMLGSHPRLHRSGRFEDPLLEWPELDALRKLKRR